MNGGGGIRQVDRNLVGRSKAGPVSRGRRSVIKSHEQEHPSPSSSAIRKFRCTCDRKLMISGAILLSRSIWQSSCQVFLVWKRS